MKFAFYKVKKLLGRNTISKSNESIKVRKVGKYILQKELGKGSVGNVWLSFHSGLGIPVAVKILKPHLIEEDPEFLDRFIQEGRLAVSLHHKNIVRIFDAGKAGESYYLVMELLEGKDALHLIQTEGAFSVENTIEIGCAVADALVEAHKHGVIHRDIKPDNIMISSDGTIKLADLGLAKKLGDEFSSTMAGSAIGTPNYMSPEQALNSREADPRCDIYSLGATLYHMLTGTLPFDGDSIMAVIMKHTNEPLEAPQSRKENLPENVCSVIVKMMDKNPEKRYQTCEEVLTALNKIRYAPTESEKPKTLVIKTKKFKRPSTKIDELKAQKESKNNKKKSTKLNPGFVAIIAAVILIPLLLIVFKPKENKKTSATDNSKVNKSAPPVSEKPPVSKKVEEVPKPEEQTKPKEPINLLADLRIPDNNVESIFLTNGVLEIKPRKRYLFLPLQGVYGNCKINLEYKFTRKRAGAKIGLLRNKTQTTNVIIATTDHKNQITGSIQVKNGISPKNTFIDAFTAKKGDKIPLGKWVNLEIILDGKHMSVLLDGVELSSYTGEYSEGGIVILAENRAHLFIRKLEVTPLN